MLSSLFKSVFNAVVASPRVTSFVWSDRLTERLWGVRVHRKVIGITWDTTSLCMRRALRDFLPRGGFHFLDMGCGQLALLSQYIRKLRPEARGVAIDIYPDFVENARYNVERNRLGIEVRAGDLFAGVTERFDVIVFNPPYVPEEADQEIEYRMARYSGVDGMDITRRFLRDAPPHLTRDGRIFLGINCVYVPEAWCVDLFRQNGYEIDGVVRQPLNTSRVFILRREA